MPPMFDGYVPNPILLSVGDWIQFAGIVPALFFLIHYGLVTPLRHKVEPWYGNPGGRMIFSLGLGFFMVDLVVLLSLVFGQSYVGREYVRIVGYFISSGSTFYLVVLYMHIFTQKTKPLPPLPMVDDAIADNRPDAKPPVLDDNDLIPPKN